MEKRIEIAGRALRLCYTVNALCAMEEMAGGSLDNIMERQFSATRLLLWAAMTEHHPETTLQAAGELIGAFIAQGGTLDEMVNLCADLMEEAGFFRHGMQE